MKIFIFVTFIIILTSCSNKMIDEFSSKKEFYQNLQQSKKIAKRGVVTYLFDKEHLKHKSTKAEIEEGERFIVGVFNDNIENNHTITLNNIAPIKITHLKNSELKNIPLYNSWSSYYLVEFKYIDKKSFKFKFDKSVIKFSKIAKYNLYGG